MRVIVLPTVKAGYPQIYLTVSESGVLFRAYDCEYKSIDAFRSAAAEYFNRKS